KEAIIVEMGDVTGVEPAFLVEALRICGGFLPVALEDEGAADEKFAVRGKLELHVGNGFAHAAQAVVRQGVEGDDGRGFGEAIAFPDGDTDGGEPASGVDAEGCSAGDEDADAAAESLVDFAVDELV